MKTLTKPFRLVITRGQGSFTLNDITPDITVGQLRQQVLDKFLEIYPGGMKPQIDWKSKESIEKIKEIALEKGLHLDDKWEITKLVNQLKQAEIDEREGLKKFESEIELD